jgi:hypothetical protein
VAISSAESSAVGEWTAKRRRKQGWSSGALDRRSDGLHRELPPASQIEITADNSEGMVSNATAGLERGEVKIRQFGGRGPIRR